MRDYSKVSAKFWIGKTGKALRKQGAEALIVGMYLMTAPNSNMLGLYYLDLPTIAHQTGLGLEGATKGLQRAIEAGFCDYDDDAEMVWVYEMAGYQVGGNLSPNDNNVKAVQKQYDDLPDCKHLRGFYEKYSLSFHMKSGRNLATPSEAPSKTLQSQEQEQEQEQEKEQEQEQDVSAPTSGTAPGKIAPKKTEPKKREPSVTDAIWDAYSRAYQNRHGVEPVRNATVNGHLFNVIKRLGAEEAPHVAAFFVSHNNRFYVEKMHPTGLLLQDCEKLRTEWATRRQMTSTQATQADKTQTNANAFGEALETALAEEAQGANYGEK